MQQDAEYPNVEQNHPAWFDQILDSQSIYFDSEIPGGLVVLKPMG